MRLIARVWHGWTRPEDAGAYERLLRAEVLPAIRGRDGCRGAYVLRHDSADESEFVTMILFDSMGAVRGFAGEQCTRAVITAEALAVLSRHEETVSHYEIRMTPDEIGGR